MDVGRRHPEANYKGGLNIKEEDDSSMMSAFITNAGKKLLSGQIADFMKFSRPAALSSHLTTLHCLWLDFLYTEFLKQAAATSDPYERLKLCTAFVLAGLHNPIAITKSKAPLNPILGETLKATKDDGTVIYLEQTVHHPPISNWECFGPGYYFSGHGTVKAGILGPNSMWAGMQGLHQVVFDDESVLSFEPPPLRVDNLIVGNRTSNFYTNFTVNYETHDLVAEITLDPKPKKILGFIGRKSKLPSDHFVIDFYRMEGNSKKSIGKGKGSWLEQLEIDGEVIWDIFDPQDDWIFEAELPSDSSNRPDLNKLKAGDRDGAQYEKDKLENLQRADKALREKAKKDRLNSKK